MQLPDPQALPKLTINLEYGDSDEPICRNDPLMRYWKYTGNPYTASTAPAPGYEGYAFAEANLSVLVLPDDIERDWWRTPESYWMRQKVRRAIKLGYELATFDFADHLDEVYEINVSADERQGRPMAEWFRQRPSALAPFGDQSCPRHRRDYFGVFRDGRLYAYALLLQCGEMMMFSQIIGHAEHLEDGVMNLLVFEVAKRRHEQAGTPYAVYHVHHSGTPGLQFFKRKMGFAGYLVEWKLGRAGVGVPARVAESGPSAE